VNPTATSDRAAAFADHHWGTALAEGQPSLNAHVVVILGTVVSTGTPPSVDRQRRRRAE
jgi:hypothetical protein